MGTRTIARIVLTLGLLLAGLTGLGIGTADPAHAAARPSAPRSVAAVAGDRSVTVRWRPPARTGGSKVTRYVVQRWLPDAQRWTTARTLGSSARTWTDVGLTNGRTYFHRVLARTKAGTGRPSRQTTAVPRGVPGAVPDVEGSTLLGGLRITWGAASGNGSAVVRYDVDLSADGGRTWTASRQVTGRATQYDGLAPGTRVRVRVRAVNAVGAGPASMAGPYTPVTTPRQVVDLRADRTADTLLVTWAPPPSGTQGWPTATRYRVEMRVGDAQQPWDLLSDPTTTSTFWIADVSDVAPGERIDVRVTAGASSDAVGFGDPLATGLPAAPGDVALSYDATDGGVLTWAAPLDDGRSPLTGYDIDTDGDGVADILGVAAGTTRRTGLDATTGTFAVRACNELAGCGAWSATVAPVPAAPTDLAATVLVDGAVPSVSLTWTAPTGPTAATGFRVLRRPEAGTDADYLTVATVTTPSYVDTAVAAASDYRYVVVALADAVPGVPTAPLSVATGPAQTLAWAVADVSLSEPLTPDEPATDVTLTLGRASTSDVVVTFASSDAGAVAEPTSVTIPAGSTSVVVPVRAVADDDTDPETATLAATAGTLSAELAVTVTDTTP